MSFKYCCSYYFSKHDDASQFKAKYEYRELNCICNLCLVGMDLIR